MSTSIPYEQQELKTTNSAAEKVVEISSLKISFGEQHVLENVSLDLYKGENLIVLGKSGSGKSVLIKCIVQLLRPDGGTIKVFGNTFHNNDRKAQSELRKRIGFLFQSGALYASMTVRENLEFPLRRYNVLGKMPSELSGGMRKRIALARTIIVDPEIMLYDEPTTGLDPITSAEISELINKIKQKYNTSSIIITHDIPCAKTIADRVILLKDGAINATGTLQELERSDDPWIRSFFI